MKVEADSSGRKRILSCSSAADMEPDRKLCRLNVLAGRSPLRTIQQSRRRTKPALVKKSSLVEGCLEVTAAVTAAPRARTAAVGARTTAAVPPKQSVKISHSYDTRAAANRKRTEEAGLAAWIAAEKKVELAAEKAELAAEKVELAAEKAELAAEKVELAAQPILLARQPGPVPADSAAPASQPTIIAQAEYVEDILQELLDQERLQWLKADFLAGQHDVASADRAVVVDWLILVQHYLRLDSGTLQLAVALLDRVLTDFSCPLDNLQLLGVTCLWLAAKMEEPRIPSAYQLLKLTMDGYTLASLLDMERLVLHVTRFRLLRVHPAALVSLQLHRRGLLAAQQDIRYDHTCSYLMDLASCQLGGVYRRPSLVAASVIYTAQLLLLRLEDSTTVDQEVDFFYCRKEDVLSVTTLLLLELRDSRTAKLQGAYKKYSSQSRYQSLALCEELSPEHAQRVLLRHLERPLPPLSTAATDPAAAAAAATATAAAAATATAAAATDPDPADLSQEF